MDCKRVRELLAEYCDGRLGAGQAGPVRAHLDGCADCRREQALLEGTWNLLLAYKPVEADVLAGVRRRLGSPMGRFLRVAAPLAAAAAVILVVVIAFAGGTPPEDQLVQAEIQKLPADDRALLLELAKDEDRELVENMDVIRSLELLGADQLSAQRDPFGGH